MGILEGLQNNRSNAQQHNFNTPQALQHTQSGINEALQKLRANPADAVKNAGLSIPEGMNDPQQIVNYLLQTGQIGNNRVQAAMQMARRMGLIG